MPNALMNNHRAATESLVAVAANSEAYGPHNRTVIGIDECVTQKSADCRTISGYASRLEKTLSSLEAVPGFVEQKV